MAKTLQIEDKYEAAFRNLMKANNIDIPSPGITVIQLDNPFTIRINDNETLEKVKNALKSTSKLSHVIPLSGSSNPTKNDIKEVIKNSIRKYLDK